MNRLRDLREDMDMSQSDLGKKVGLSAMAISRYEREEAQLTAELIIELSSIFKCTADYLLGLSAQRHPAVSNPDTELLHAYHSAPAPIRAAVDGLLEPYKDVKNKDAIEAS